MNEMYFTEEHNLFRESLKDFLQKEVVPHIEEWEESGKIDKSISIDDLEEYLVRC